MSQKIQLEMRDHTALLTIANPPANTWDLESLAALEETIGQLNDDPNVYALVITGQGEKFFSAGADLKQFASGDKVAASKVAEHFGRAFDALTRFRGVAWRTYSVDILGAGAGSLGVVALLFVLSPTDVLRLVGTLGAVAGALAWRHGAGAARPPFPSPAPRSSTGRPLRQHGGRCALSPSRRAPPGRCR